MTKKEKFIEFVRNNLFEGISAENIDNDILIYWEALKNSQEQDKPVLTDNGKLVLKYLQDHPEVQSAKARDIAEELFISSRTVSGSMRKLVNDGFVEKIGQDPTVYSITEEGKNLQID